MTIPCTFKEFSRRGRVTHSLNSVTRAFFEIADFFFFFENVGKKCENGQNCEKSENSCNKMQLFFLGIF